MVVMLLGKLRGLPTHTDIIVDFEFKEVGHGTPLARPATVADGTSVPACSCCP